MNNINWEHLASEAWKVREYAYIIGKTKVGAAILTESGKIYSGCNIEHKYRNHDVHAEVNAITKMITNGENRFIAIIVVSDKQNFSPCGSCLDWIFQFGGPKCLVSWQSTRNGKIITREVHELMPYYPY